MFHLKEGDQAPDILSKDENGEDIQLSDYRGKKVILYFYPRDNTPTCTVESCNLRDNYTALKKKGFEVIGISNDTSKKHTNFIKKYDLPFKLVADTDMKVVNDYGIWGEKKFMGRTFDGLHRTTFVISEEGIIEKIINKVKSKDHANQILEALQASN
jgi:peroxiredoxin Q/BCP